MLTGARFRTDGPSVTSVSSLIAPMLDSYVELIQFEVEEKPYVFTTKDGTRCYTSSAWSAYAKSIFKKWSGIAYQHEATRTRLERSIATRKHSHARIIAGAPPRC